MNLSLLYHGTNVEIDAYKDSSSLRLQPSALRLQTSFSPSAFSHPTSDISLLKLTHLSPVTKSSIMIVTNQVTDTKRNATSTRNRIMASTMSVDEYFDELIDKMREDYANL